MPSKSTKHLRSVSRGMERCITPEYGAMSAHDSALAKASYSALSFRCQPLHYLPGNVVLVSRLKMWKLGFLCLAACIPGDQAQINLNSINLPPGMAPPVLNP